MRIDRSRGKNLEGWFSVLTLFLLADGASDSLISHFCLAAGVFRLFMAQAGRHIARGYSEGVLLYGILDPQCKHYIMRYHTRTLIKQNENRYRNFQNAFGSHQNFKFS